MSIKAFNQERNIQFEVIQMILEIELKNIQQCIKKLQFSSRLS